MASPSETLQQSPLAYFIAGVLVSASYFYFASPRARSGGEYVNIDGEWDDESEEEHHDANHPLQNQNNPASSWGYMDAPYKMVLCVNQDLGMGKGKTPSCFVRALIWVGRCLV
jgi:hypothetical protein